MTVHDIVQPMLDSATLVAIAERAGITPAQAKAVLGMLADLPIRTAVRLCTTAQLDRIRQAQREARKR